MPVPETEMPVQKPDPTAALSDLEFALLNRFQRDFPLQLRPFASLADKLGSDETTVIERLRSLQQRGAVSRVGAVFAPHAIGTSALAALSVPKAHLEDVARHVSGFPEVNHNYEREHRYNLWFVVTAASSAQLQAVLHDIEEACNCGPVLVLPMLAQYHIDLGFDLAADKHPAARCHPVAHVPRLAPISLEPVEQAFVAALQGGLPIVERPFACLGVPELQAIDTISRWIDEGVIKRFGVVVRHHELGYTANAMAVWDVPDEVVDEVGKRIAANGGVTLCYRRLRHLPDWRYNLFCMVHGKDRDDVAARVAALSQACGLKPYPHEVLFSRRRFKQCGAHYAKEAAHG